MNKLPKIYANKINTMSETITLLYSTYGKYYELSDKLKVLAAKFPKEFIFNIAYVTDNGNLCVDIYANFKFLVPVLKAMRKLFGKPSEIRNYLKNPTIYCSSKIVIDYEGVTIDIVPNTVVCK